MSAKSPYPTLPSHLGGFQASGYRENEPVAQFEIGDYRNFIYLVLDAETKQAAVIDPQEDLEPIESALAQGAYTLKAIWLTHTHFDHIAGVEPLLESRPDLPVYVHSADTFRLKESSALFQKAVHAFEDGARLKVGSLTAVAHHTPGHSAGGTSYFLEAKGKESGLRRYLFSGDTLFIRDCGRTDLETGSNKQMFESLQKYKKLQADTIVLPGHHYAKECASPLEKEMRESPPLLCKSVDELARLP